MTVKLEDAVERCNERLMAIAGDDLTEYGSELDHAGIAKMLIGTDLRVDDIAEVAEKKAITMSVAFVENDLTLRQVLAGIYFQGVVEGLTLAEMRTQEEAEG